MEEQNRGELNGILTLLLGLNIVASIIQFVIGISPSMECIEYGDYGPMIWNVVNTIITIVSIIGVLKIRLWGFALMIGWHIIVLFTEMTVPDYFEINALRNDSFKFIFMIAIFFLKSDGVSAWSLFLEQLRNISHSDDEMNQSMSKQDLKEQDIVTEHKNFTEHVEEKSPKELNVLQSNINGIYVQTDETHSNVNDTVHEKDNDCDVGNASINNTTDKDNNKEISSPDKSIDKNHKQSKSKKIMLVTVLCVLVIGCTIAGYEIYNNTDNRYDRAEQTFKTGKIDKALSLFKELADEGDVRSMTRLGNLYLENDSVPYNKDAFTYLKKASISDTIALSSLMAAYSGAEYKGHDFTDSKSAKYYANIAISRNVLLPQAYYTLGNAYSEDNEISKAFYYWEKSSTYNYADAYDNLGWTYATGNGGVTNYDKALDCFKKALQINSSDDYALFYLGLMYYNGAGVSEDHDQGISYLRKAADLGNEDAQAELGKIELNK